MESKPLPIEEFEKRCIEAHNIIIKNDETILTLNRQNEKELSTLRDQYYKHYRCLSNPFGLIYDACVTTHSLIRTNKNKIQLLNKQRKQKIAFLTNYYSQNYPNATLSFKAFYDHCLKMKQQNKTKSIFLKNSNIIFIIFCF